MATKAHNKKKQKRDNAQVAFEVWLPAEVAETLESEAKKERSQRKPYCERVLVNHAKTLNPKIKSY